MAAKNPAKYFIRKDVSDILVKLTGMDLNKIFKPSYNPRLTKSEIKLLTSKQLEIVIKFLFFSIFKFFFNFQFMFFWKKKFNI